MLLSKPLQAVPLYSRLSSTVLRWAKVAPQPEPPIGEPSSIRTFRAGKNYYYVRLLRWGSGQIGAVIGLVFSIGFVTWFADTVERVRIARSAPPAAASPSPGASPTPSPLPALSPSPAVAVDSDGSTPSPSPAVESVASAKATPTPRARRRADRIGFDIAFLRVAIERMPRWLAEFVVSWTVPLLFFLEYLGILAFLAQFPVTYALVRIEFEQHWYIVTDRSLRIRTGLLSLSESTMSFANLQQVEVKQGPLQRFLGVADVRVRSAGGGDSSSEDGSEEMHTGVFHSVDNAGEIRDLILARLRAYKETGLGEAEETPARLHQTKSEAMEAAIEAAREVLRQTRALRAATTAL